MSNAIKSDFFSVNNSQASSATVDSTLNFYLNFVYITHLQSPSEFLFLQNNCPQYNFDIQNCQSSPT